MLGLSPNFDAGKSPDILCLGAHSDDIEIGALATVLHLAKAYPSARVTWAVFSASGERSDEARSSAEYCTQGFSESNIRLFEFPDGHFPQELTAIKAAFEELKTVCSPDLVLTHYREDRHQDHRTISDVTWQTFRDHLVLEYEIPKYDGDFGIPNFFVPASQEFCKQKLEILDRFFGSQRSKGWFNEDLFMAVMRLRGMECRSPTDYAEAFYVRKAVFG